MMSTDFLIFEGRDSNDKKQVGIVNFMHNVKCNRVQTRPVTTLPIGFYSDKDLKSSHFIGTLEFTKA